MTTREELTGEEGGRWRVWTQASHYDVDLDAMTITRVPGPSAPPTVNDVTRPIREIHRCRVGARGYWTMRPTTPIDVIDKYWQLTSEISRIEQLGDDKGDAQEVGP